MFDPLINALLTGYDSVQNIWILNNAAQVLPYQGYIHASKVYLLAFEIL